MSKYGDNNMHMEELFDALTDRAAEVGFTQTLSEVLRVLRDFTESQG